MSDDELRARLDRIYGLLGRVARAVITDPAELAKLQAELKTSADTLAAAVATASTPKTS
jgi:hypothetical protein